MTRRRVIVHVLPADLPRGAQVYARALRIALDTEHERHRTWAIFSAPPAGLRPDRQILASPRPRSGAPINPRAVYRLRRALLKKQPDVVIAHGSEALKYVALACPRPVPFVYYRIGVAQGRPQFPGRRLAHRFLARRADLVAGVSQETLDECRDVLDVEPAKLRLIYNGRDPDVFRPRNTHAVDGVPRLVFIGHLTDTKRPQLFISVVQRLKAAGVRLEATIVGDGPLSSGLEALAHSAGVVMLGSRHDVPEILAQSDVLLFTSVRAGEGMPGILIEAGLSGLPVVATAVPGVASVVLDEETGFVVAPYDYERMLAATQRLISDRDLRHRMGYRARHHCVTNFSLAGSADRWRQVLSELATPFSEAALRS